MSDKCSSIGSARRYYLAKRHAASSTCSDLVDFWKYKQESEPGTPLPADFPYLEELEIQGYTTVEDLTGASSKELIARGFVAGEADIIFSAIDEL